MQARASTTLSLACIESGYSEKLFSDSGGCAANSGKPICKSEKNIAGNSSGLTIANSVDLWVSEGLLLRNDKLVFE